MNSVFHEFENSVDQFVVQHPHLFVLESGSIFKWKGDQLVTRSENSFSMFGQMILWNGHLVVSTYPEILFLDTDDLEILYRVWTPGTINSFVAYPTHLSGFTRMNHVMIRWDETEERYLSLHKPVTYPFSLWMKHTLLGTIFLL